MANGLSVTAEPAKQAAPSSDDDRIFAAISYVLGLLISIVIYLVKKDSKPVRFHAMQAILLDIVVLVLNLGLAAIFIGGIFVLGIATGGIGFMAFPIVWLVFILWGLLLLALRLYLAWKAYNNEMFKLPLLGDQAEKMASG